MRSCGGILWGGLCSAGHLWADNNDGKTSCQSIAASWNTSRQLIYLTNSAPNKIKISSVLHRPGSNDKWPMTNWQFNNSWHLLISILQVKDLAATKYNYTFGKGEVVSTFVAAFYDAVLLYALALNKTLQEAEDPRGQLNGASIISNMKNRSFQGNILY